MMVAGLVLYVLAMKALILGAGFVILFYTVRAARSTGDEGLWFLSLGLFLVGAGVFFAGWLHRPLGISITAGLALTSTTTAVGLVVVVVSMFTDARIPVRQ